MECICGKMMMLLWTLKDLKIWSCSPLGCGRIYLEGKGTEIAGTWYLPEKNECKEEF
jgi:diadenosine tetraphosphatase ApaH/serine/threonine PP2A family protein phosphatase